MAIHVLVERLGRSGRGAHRHRAFHVAAAVAVAAGAVLALSPGTVRAGGGPENAVLVVDPMAQDSLYVANHYIAARGIPAANVLYMPSGASDYQAFVDFQLDALLGTLGERGLDDHVDYVIVPPGSPFYVSVPQGLIFEGGCPAPVRRLAISSAYGLAYSADEILAGGLTYSESNRYFGKAFLGNEEPLAFDSRTSWLNGAPSNSSAARRYFLGFMLGYDGPRGNTVDDTILMINRSVAADGSQPSGTFYLMRTDDIRSTPRHPHFSSTISAIERLGGAAEEIYKVDDQVAIVPAGRDDILGVMTGHASPDIDGTGMTIIPGSFADHLTSFAATFDTSGQRKMSRWIANGASGTMGTVEEPCVFGTGVTGKFPHPWLYVWYFQGLSLGESLFRSLEWAPFQSLFYGDPLTQPYAEFPTVSVAGLPAGAASGQLVLDASAETADGQPVSRYDLYVDGILHDSAVEAEGLYLDTTVLADGSHEIAVVGYAETDAQTQGRSTHWAQVANSGLGVSLTADATTGDLGSTFKLDVSAAGAGPTEVRLLARGRVVAAAAVSDAAPAAQLEIPATAVGAGEVELLAEADFASGRTALSEPLSLSIDYSGVPAPSAEETQLRAYSYTAYLDPDHHTLVDTPGYDMSGGPAGIEVTSVASRAAISVSGSAALLRPMPDALGTDSFEYRVVSGTLSSEPATVTIRYCRAPEITSQPQAVLACPGRVARFEVDAEGERLAYQWFKDDVLMAGETAPVLEIDEPGEGDLASYSVDVRTICGTPLPHVRSVPGELRAPGPGDSCTVDAWLPLATTGS